MLMLMHHRSVAKCMGKRRGFCPYWLLRWHLQYFLRPRDTTNVNLGMVSSAPWLCLLPTHTLTLLGTYLSFLCQLLQSSCMIANLMPHSGMYPVYEEILQVWLLTATPSATMAFFSNTDTGVTTNRYVDSFGHGSMY